ncbi:peptidoglycan DD-metalloendopeptidase family protein [Flavobacteriaceae bacterium SZ-1-7]|uniref:peptidoglycan DD-metalloendopeptidase family protein n=1 Tax=Tamlana sedimenti TaxID=3134126 RepID=UPI0031268E6D
MQPHEFSQFLNQISSEALFVLDTSIPKEKYVPLDLSESNGDLKKVDVSSSEKLGTYISEHIKNHNALVAYGGYLEVRTIYQRSIHFNKQNTEARNIHLGIDLWSEAGSAVFAPLDGEVHSFKNNANYGDYGPTIILKHQIEDEAFYTLYGHLSLESMAKLKIGQTFKQGDCLGTLGDAKVNGDYPPHLHLQIIKDIQGFMGDYPGVCSQTDLEFYKANCPNPNLLLKL